MAAYIYATTDKFFLGFLTVYKIQENIVIVLQNS